MSKFHIFYFIILISTVATLHAQSDIDSNTVIYGWKLDKDFLTPEKTPIDTLLPGFQQDGIVLKKYHSVSYLGGNGSAYLSNNFFDRNTYEGLLFLGMYKDNFSTAANTQYLNTRKPFTHILYINAGPKSEKEEGIRISHSQNIGNKTNFGFEYGVLSNKGQYKYLNTNVKNFKTFGSYNGKRYTVHATYNTNKYIAEENGGIIDSIYLNENLESKLIETNFKGETGSPYQAYVNSKIRYYDGMLSQRYKLLTLGKVPDSLGRGGTMAEPIISHVFHIQRASKIYSEDEKNDPALPIYNNYYSNINETYDSIAEFKVTNKFQLDFKTRLKNKVIVGLYGSINHDYVKYSYYSLPDTNITNMNQEEKRELEDSTLFKFYRTPSGDTIYNINRTKNLTNLYITAGIYGKFWTHIQGSFSGKLYFAGYKAGQTQLDGHIITKANILKRPFELYVGGAIENIVPSYQLNNYYSNNYIWEQGLNSVNKLTLSSKLAAPSNKFELSGDYALISNHIYITDSMPVNHSGALSMINVGLEKEFVLWKFHLFNKLMYQVSGNRDIVDVPGLILYNSTYFDHTWNFNITGGKLRTMVGVDIHYNTSFNGYNYIPSLGMFYQDDNKQTIGNYPFIDVWMNVRLKRTRFFAKYEHVNSTGKRKDYYHAVSYPAYQQVFKFGLSWTFYN